MRYETQKIRELISKLNEAAKAYYSEDNEIMTDREYDMLYDELKMLEERTGTVYPDSPTVNVGYRAVSSLEKVKHPTKMLSLDKTKDVDKLRAFLGNKEGVMSYKMDGLTIVLNYEDGELVRAVTRGNGEIGEDITHNAKVFKNVPLKIGLKERLTLRGEAVIHFSDFERINEDLGGTEKYKNPRNLCSGTVRQLDSKIAAERNVYFYAFALVEGGSFDKRTEQFEYLKELGFNVVEYRPVTSDNVADVVGKFGADIPNKPYATDGLVLSFNDIAYGMSLGTTAKFPRDSMAFKWKDETAETVLREIEWNTSRTGSINPVAVFDSVELEGTTVNRASLHNVSVIENLELAVGDKITVYKANMIIPQIAENLTRSGAAEPPSKCPVCGEDTEVVALNDGKTLKCTNPNCHARLVYGITHYASRDAMNIEGLSENTVEKFVKRDFLRNYTDLYTLDKHKEEIMEMDGFGELSYKNLISSIERSKTASLPNFIYALGIDNVGLVNARLISSHFDYDIEKIFSASEEEFCAIDGVGGVIASSAVKYFSNEKNRELIKKALGFLNMETPLRLPDTNKVLENLTFVITGDVHIFKNRKELKSKIEELGGKVVGSVSSKTDYLINNDIGSSSSKNKKAKELSVPVIGEEELMRMINE